ncbi:MAG: PepSY-like domain-containing protein [Candidatus Saccharibacteria bacterium]
MRKLLLLFIIMAFVLGVSALNQKEEKIPAAAKTAFATKFPTAEKVKWSVEKPGEFEAEFKQNGVESSVLFDDKGNLIETETEVKESDLPPAVKSLIAKDFSGYKLDEIEKAADAKGSTTYEMEAVKGKEKLEISFDSNGKLLKKEPLKEKEKD